MTFIVFLLKWNGVIYKSPNLRGNFQKIKLCNTTTHTYICNEPECSAGTCHEWELNLKIKTQFGLMQEKIIKHFRTGLIKVN